MTNKYKVEMPPFADVYDILVAYNVTNPGLQHAIKKLLMAGKRGHKDVSIDLVEAISAISRAIEIENGKKDTSI